MPGNISQDRNLPFNEAKRVEIRRHALEIARKHGYDVNPPDFIAGVEQSLKETHDAGLKNILMTTGGRRYKHEAMQKAGLGGYFTKSSTAKKLITPKSREFITSTASTKMPALRIVLLTGTATYVRAGNNVSGCKVGDAELEVVTVALSTEHSYNDEETLAAAKPTSVNSRL